MYIYNALDCLISPQKILTYKYKNKASDQTTIVMYVHDKGTYFLKYIMDGKRLFKEATFLLPDHLNSNFQNQ